EYVSAERPGWDRRDTTDVALRSHPRSGRLAHQTRHAQRQRTIGGDRVVAAMAMAAAGVAFFFHVGYFATCGHLAIPADHASAAQSREAEKPNETHHALRS